MLGRDVAVATTTTTVLASLLLLRHLFSRRRHVKNTRCGGSDVARGIEELIGNTPMIRIASVSEATGCDIFAKAEV
jgi:cysteine synthase A